MTTKRRETTKSLLQNSKIVAKKNNHSMDLNSMLMLPTIILLVVLFMIISSTSTFTNPALASFPIAKPGCDDHCGNVSIPFPFGMKEGCYLDSGFIIDCLNSSNNVPPQPVLWDTTVTVTDISLEGQLRVLQYMGYDCYDQNISTDFTSAWIGITEPLIFNSTANKFTAIGCDTYAVVQGTSKLRTYETGCISVCDSEVVDDSCSGIGCCQTSIPTGSREINVSISSFYNYSGSNSCSYAFVVDEKAFKFSADNLTNISKDFYPPVIVDWVIAYEKCEVARKNSTTYACKENSVCYDPVGALSYRCRCNDGYDGNPYLPNGCQDIDECGDPNLKNCAKNSSCSNTVGGYSCKCNEGFHGNATEGAEGCIADQKRNYWPIFAGVGVSAGTIILLVFSFCLYIELMRRKANRLREEFFRKNGGFILQQKLTELGGGTYSAKIYTLEELKKATNDFDESQIIGRGGFGTVFKGELDNTTVAVKKSRVVDQHQVEQFINEVIMLSQINNRNVVKLLGCCLETEVPQLVYEFINNGTVFEHLHNKIKAIKLSWNIRLRIASEIAGVLSYLHSVALPPIIHRDIKSANILLDQNFAAKVSDFGISRLVPMDENQVSTMVQGTPGYLDPEYLQEGLLTEKSDVYSFGILLMELLTGRKAVASDKPEAERFLAYHFISSLKEDRLVQVLDVNILCNENIEELKEIAMIAKKCINKNGEDRPSMKDVARELELLEIKAKKISVQVFEIDSTEREDRESSLYMQSIRYASSDEPTSSDLYPLSHSTTEQILLPIAGGR